MDVDAPELFSPKHQLASFDNHASIAATAVYY